MTQSSAKLLINSRLLAVLVLGFSSGLPMALTSSTLQAWFTQAKINLSTIGIFSLLGLPYILKFLWAPLMDYYACWPRLGKRKGWILSMQLGVIITLLTLAQLDPNTQALQMGVVALAIAFFSASQDISITAYQTDVLPAPERGLGASYYVFAYRCALLIAGGAALSCAGHLGWKATYEIMALLLTFCMLATYYSPKPTEYLIPSGDLMRTMLTGIGQLLQQEKIVYLLLFIFFYKFGDALALQLMMNFLLNGLGFSLNEVGTVYKSMSFVGTILGGFVGGVILLRWNIYQALLWFGLAQALSNLTFVALAMVDKNLLLMAVSIFIENFCSGLSTAALLAYMMSLCNHRYTASQFALLSAVASAPRVFLGPVAAHLVQAFGWANFYMGSFMLCFPGIIFLMLLKNRVIYHAQTAVD